MNNWRKEITVTKDLMHEKCEYSRNVCDLMCKFNHVNTDVKFPKGS